MFVKCSPQHLGFHSVFEDLWAGYVCPGTGMSAVWESFGVESAVGPDVAGLGLDNYCTVDMGDAGGEVDLCVPVVGST